MTPQTLEELARIVARHEQRLAEAERRLAALEPPMGGEGATRAIIAAPAEAELPIPPIAPPPPAPAAEPEPVEAPEPLAVPPPLPPVRRPAAVAAAVAIEPPAAAAPAPIAEPVVPSARPIARSAEFLAEDEFLGAPAAKHEAPYEPRPQESLETMLARWLPVVGGVLVTAGAAIYATVVDSPFMKIAIGYILCAVVGAAGLFALKRARMVGRAMIAIALSLAYFVSFASHYVPPARIFPALVSILLMVGSAGALFGLAERWKSQLVAGLGLALGILAALISASTSQGFALISLSLLAAGSGWLLVRNEWKTLTAMSLCGTYLGTALLWFILPVDASSGDPLVHTFALAFYHATFMAAFWKWGRIWAARERALEEAAKTEAIPAMEIHPSLYASAGATLNSLFLSGLSVWLWWRTESMWPSVHWLLFALAAVEIVRLAVRPLRRSASVGFHAVLAFALVCSGVANAFSGLAEGAVMAALAAAIAVAASRMPLLRWIKPLTAVCAGLSAAAVAQGAFVVATPADLFSNLLPAVFLLASCLAWEELLPRCGDTKRHIALKIAEGLSGQLRGFTAVCMAIATIATYSSPNDPPGALAFGALAFVLCLGILVFAANAWWLGTLVAAGAMMIAFVETQDAGAGIVALHAMGMLAVLWALGEAMRRAGHIATRALFLLLAASSGLAVTAYLFELLLHNAQWPGLWIMSGGAIAAAVGALFLRLPRVPCLARTASADSPSEQSFVARIAALATPALAVAAFSAVGGAMMMFDFDARSSLVSPAIPTALLLAGWAFLSVRKLPIAASLSVLFAATGLFLPSVVIYGEGHASAVLGAGALAAVLLVFGIGARQLPATICGGAWIAALPVCMLGALARDARLAGIAPDFRATNWELSGVLAAAIVVATALAPKLAARRIGADRLPRTLAPLVAEGTAWWFAATGAAVALLFLSAGDLVPGKFVTPSWGAVGALMLVLGLVANVAPLRYVALGVFAVAIGRIFLHDLSGASNVVKALAFLSVGVLLLAAGFAYVFRRKIGAGKAAEKEGG